MNWRAGLAVAILALWFFFLVDSRGNPESKEVFDSLNGFALAAATFLFAEPVIRERHDRKKRRRRDDDD